MRKATSLFLALIVCGQMNLQADASDDTTTGAAPALTTAMETPPVPEIPPVLVPEPPKPAPVPFTAFTGKISKNKVRMRMQPNLDSPILRELNKDDMLVVVGESEDFYAVLPPRDIKAFIFRTFVLDNVVEGNRVNVRLEPDIDSPVIAQLNTGDKVEGSISPLNSKWMEIVPPESTRFFVSKEYIQKVGDPSLMATIAKRREEVNRLLNSTYQISQTELQKQFSEIDLEGVNATLNSIVKEYTDFPDQVARAKELLTISQESYYQKKIAYLENKAQEGPSIASADLVISTPDNLPVGGSTSFNLSSKGAGAKMESWIPVEELQLNAWLGENPDRTKEDFYNAQKANGIVLRGVIEPYHRSVRNKPGDYLLVNQSNKLPIAYLYSTEVNLDTKLGQEVTVTAAARPNNNFAFPAYFVLSVE